MLEIIIGHDRDDFLKEKLTVVVKKDHKTTSFSKIPESIMSNYSIMSKYIIKKVKPFITDEKDVTVVMAGAAKFSTFI